MKKGMIYNRIYEKNLRMPLEEKIEETLEYEVLARHYPHIAESIKLKKDLKRLDEKLKSLRRSPAAIQIKREATNIEVKLKRVNISKRLHGESWQEAIFHTICLIRKVKGSIHSFIRYIKVTLGKPYGDARKVFLSSVFDLKSLYIAERDMAVRDWLHGHYKKPSIRLVSPFRPIKKTPFSN